MVILGGIRVFQQARIWLEGRMFMAWLDALKNAVLDALSVISIRLPELVTRLADFLADEVWPLFWEALAQPIIWLAVAALVFGSAGAVAGRAVAQGRALPGEGPRFDGLRQPRRASAGQGQAAAACRASVGRRSS